MNLWQISVWYHRSSVPSEATAPMLQFKIQKKSYGAPGTANPINLSVYSPFWAAALIGWEIFCLFVRPPNCSSIHPSLHPSPCLSCTSSQVLLLFSLISFDFPLLSLTFPSPFYTSGVTFSFLSPSSNLQISPSTPLPPPPPLLPPPSSSSSSSFPSFTQSARPYRPSYFCSSSGIILTQFVC